MVTPEIREELCTGCGECVEACPVHALALKGGHAAVVGADDCQYCGDCEDLCPEGAIARSFEVVLADPGEGRDIGGSDFLSDGDCSKSDGGVLPSLPGLR